MVLSQLRVKASVFTFFSLVSFVFAVSGVAGLVKDG
jgi:hypothetical protein